MGKKDGKRVDKEKLEAKKQRQANKQNKTANKRAKKELKDTGEEDIEAIIAEFSAKDAARVAVTVTVAPQPSARANFSMTALPNGDMLLFGGEFCDGESTEVFNDLYRWNLEKNEWKQIESLNTPPPRCSHQSVFYKDKLYLFGGEYATLDQFHHYRDFWELDLKSNAWTEIKATGDVPTARSGHRMVVWRNYLVLFGGFYEAMREVRWYNDIFLYSFQDHRWLQIPYKANTQVPKPRSGVQMCVHSQEDSIYIYGGYSKEKVTGSKKEGKVHEDMWCLNLKPILNAAAGGAKGGISSLDISKATWQKISRKGDYPSARCGSGMTMYKNKALLFGGVFDDEGPRHSLVSTFFNDLFAFDMERRRWYKLGLKQKKTKVKLSSADKKARRAQKQAAAAAAGADDDADGGDSEGVGSDEDEDSEDDDDEDAEEADASAGDAQGLNPKGEFFGYIDENGEVVYINLNDDGETVAGAGSSTDAAAASVSPSASSPMVTETVFNQVIESASALSIQEEEQQKQQAAAAEAEEARRQAETLKNQQKYQNKQNRLKDAAAAAAAMGEEDAKIDGEGSPMELSEAALANQSFVAKYFNEQTVPCTRINPCMLIKGNTLYIYGGVTELGDIEVTLDDCWSLDLNKRDTWKKVLAGSMHTLVWKGVDEDDVNSSHYSSMNEDSSDDDDDDDDDSDDESDEDSEEDAKAAKNAHKRSAKKIAADEDEEEGGGKKSSSKSKSKSSSSSGSKGGLRAEMEGLRSHFDMTDSSRTPLAEETLRQFYSRTTEHWAKEVVAQWHAKQEQAAADGTINKNETLSEKEIKRQGFLLAEVRYNELLPLLARLNELEAQQREEEERHNSKGKSSSKKR